MRIEVKGRNVPVSEDLRELVERRFRVIGKQVSDLAELEVEVAEEHNPSISESQVAEATLHLKGVTLRASSASNDMRHSINVVSEELGRQVKRHREKRRKRREARVPEVIGTDVGEVPAEEPAAALQGVVDDVAEG
ncbi:MAG TPA: ribosome-associated translation inhibitor RaiA [Solirubrobacteraceae bacterium]|nr:ribosome-associated translation inhibitor RaiA [Solirubrobacteraceae bacterium]